MRRWGKRFFASTRGRVVQLLRRGKASVNQLAQQMQLTDNAVRAHLTTLERDGLVQEAGKRPGVRKPETLYALHPEAEALFPKAYHLLFNQLLHVLSQRLAPAEIEDILRTVGQGLADSNRSLSAHATPEERMKSALAVLEHLGGLAEVVETPETFVLQGYSCPLAAAVSVHPEVCQLAEALLSDVVGAPVEEACDRSQTPRCRFHVAKDSLQ